MTREVQIRAWANRTAQPSIEARVLAEVLTNPVALAIAADLEIGDFTDPRFACAFRELRELQADGADIGVLEVADAIAMRDMALDTHKADTVSVAFLAALVANADRYPPQIFEGVFTADLRQLRLIANERRKL